MSYDIPDKIQYREKIVFNLDFKQLLYACVFGLLAFFSLNLSIGGDAKLVLPTVFAVAGLGFIFLNLEEKALDAYNYYSGVRKAKSSDRKAQDLVGIKAIKDDALYLKDGGLRAVLKVEPVNFSLLDESQKKSLTLSYREFLNHLTTPIQILVRTSKPDLEEYFAEAQEKLRNAPKQLSSIFNDFFVFEQDFLEKHEVRERKYYLVVTHQADKAFFGKRSQGEDLKRLDQKTKIIQEKLAACGLNSRRLETEDLTRFFATYSSREQEPQEGAGNEKTA